MPKHKHKPAVAPVPRAKSTPYVQELVDGALRVWWIPQVGADIPPFNVEVTSLVEAKKLLRTLARYDEYQLVNRIKPDYSNIGGLEVYVAKTREWEEWTDDEHGLQIDEHDDDALIEMDGQRRVARAKFTLAELAGATVVHPGPPIRTTRVVAAGPVLMNPQPGARRRRQETP